MNTPLPQRAATARGVTPAVDFRQQHIPPAAVAPNMGDLAARVRSLMDLQHGRPLQLPLGGRFFDVVVTAACPEAHAVVSLMDAIQYPGHGRLDACGPVIEDPARQWLIWLVPPGTSERWTPHRYGMCLGSPHEFALPPMGHTEPPGPYWLRPCNGDRLVPPAPLREHLDQFRPRPTPHEEVLADILCTIS